MPLSVFLIAGESSGDMLGAGLIRALKTAAGDDIRLLGVGGERMEAEGLKSEFPYHELSMMGFAEVVPHMTQLMMRMNQVVERIVITRPDVVVTIDSPGFNFRVVRRLRKDPRITSRFVHYVAPTVWAYKPGRAAKCAKLFDHLLVLLPFEPPYFMAAGLPTTYVGHPVASMEPGDGAAFRATHQLAPEALLLCLLPGSRETEIKRHMPVFAQTALRLAQRFPGLTLAVPVSERLLPLVMLYFQGCPFRAILVHGESQKRDAIAASNAAIVKSGTVSLEVARLGCPQVVTYKTGRITAMLVRRMLRVPYVNLINILNKEEAIPELLQERCTPDHLVTATEALLTVPALRERQRKAAEDAFAQLQGPGEISPHEAAARAVLSVVKGGGL